MLGVVIIFLSPCILVVAALSGSTIVPSMQGDLPALVVAALSGSNCAEQGENVAEPERQDNNYMHSYFIIKYCWFNLFLLCQSFGSSLTEMIRSLRVKFWQIYLRMMCMWCHFKTLTSYIAVAVS